MADATGAISLYAVRLRLARLDASGAPLVGPESLLVTDSLVRVDYEPTYAETDAVTKTKGNGKFCLNIPPRKNATGCTLTVEICEDDPALYEMLAGGSVLTEGASDIVGYQYPKSTDPEDNAISLEVWTEAWSGSSRDPVRPYFWYPFPAVKLSQGARSLAAAPDEKVFEGTGAENLGWGTGPADNWTHDSGAAVQFIRTAIPPPAVTNGYAPIVAPA